MKTLKELFDSGVQLVRHKKFGGDPYKLQAYVENGKFVLLSRNVPDLQEKDFDIELSSSTDYMPVLGPIVFDVDIHNKNVPDGIDEMMNSQISIFKNAGAKGLRFTIEALFSASGKEGSELSPPAPKAPKKKASFGDGYFSEEG